jgi:hypothetical protein
MNETVTSTGKPEEGGGSCPLQFVRDAFASLAQTSFAVANGRGESSLTTALGNSVSSALQANAVLLDQIADIARRLDGSGTRPSTDPARAAVRDAAAPSTERRATRAVVLRGVPGSAVSGSFALENLRSEPVLASVRATTFVDSSGDPVDVALTIEPDEIRLDPAAEVVVTLSAVVPIDLARRGQLHGTIEVPGLTTAVVPVVVESDRPDDLAV